MERNLVVLVRRQHGGDMQPNSFDVIRIPTSGPGDVSGLMALIDGGALEPSSILAVLGKTEGNGGVNDFTREDAVAALCTRSRRLSSSPPARSRRGSRSSCRVGPRERCRRTSRCSREACLPSVGPPSGEKRLSVGIAHTRGLLPEEIGRDAQIGETTRAVGGDARRTIEAVRTCISSRSNARF